MEEEIIDALESTAGNRKNHGRIGDPAVPDKQDITDWRNRLMRFLEELDADITVGEIRSVLEDYS